MANIQRLIAVLSRRMPYIPKLLRQILPIGVKRKLGSLLLSNNDTEPVFAYDNRKFFMIPDRLFVGVLYSGNYEPLITDFVEKVVRRGDTCVDLGANFGWFTTLMVKNGATVHSYEPGKRIRGILERNIKLNGMQENVVIRGAAVGAQPGRATLVIEGSSDRESALGYIGSTGDQDNSDNHEVIEVVALQEELAAHQNNVAFIKMDVEGYEFYALQGAEALLSAEHPPIIVMEANSEALERAGVSLQLLCNHMIDLGFQLYKLTDNGKLTDDIFQATELVCVPRNGRYSERVRKRDIS